MLARLRQQPWLAALLVMLSPAVAGVVLPVLHPCPVDAPWLAATAGPAESGVHHGTSHGSDQQQTHHQCSCIGGCSTPSLVATPAVPLTAEAVRAPETTAWPVVEGLAVAWHVLQRLPETTAPPLV